MEIIVEIKKNKNKELLNDGLKYSLILFYNNDLVSTCYKHIIDIIKYLNVENMDFLFKYGVNIVNGNLLFKSRKKAEQAKKHIESLIVMNKFIIAR